MTDRAGQAERAEYFRRLHAGPKPLLLANVWDAGSAYMVASAGASAVATSSDAVSWAHGVPDGHNLSLDTVRASLREIVGAVGDLPVTADIEGGYAQDPDGVGASVAAAIEAGVVGINLEDSGAPAGSATAPLFTAEDQAERIAAARDAARRAGIDRFQSTYSHAQQVARTLFDDGSYAGLDSALGFGDFNDAFRTTSDDGA